MQTFMHALTQDAVAPVWVENNNYNTILNLKTNLIYLTDSDCTILFLTTRSCK